jgi:hypothetical protein
MSKTTLWAAIAGLCACSPAPPPPPPAPVATAQPAATPPPPPPATASAPAPAPPPEPLTTAPTFPSMEDAERSKLPGSLDEVKKSFDEKFYAQGADLLEKEAKKPGITVDYQVLVYALLGHARHMTNELPLATQSYRRVLSKWGPFNKLGKKLSKGTPEEKHRYVLGMEAFGEALFFLAEQKRTRLEDITAPSFDKDDTPEMVKMFAKGKVAGYLASCEQIIKGAKKKYQKVLDLKPEPPKRWAVATHSRIGAMYGTCVEGLRAITVKKENRKPIDDKMAPFLAKAKEAYRACQSAAQGAEPTVFSKSCANWLKANP